MIARYPHENNDLTVHFMHNNVYLSLLNLSIGANHQCVFANVESLRWLSGRRTLSHIHICSFGILFPVFRDQYSPFKADLMQVFWKYPPGVSPVGFLIRSPYAVAHTSGPLYLLLNHLITLSSINLHNWMKRRNRSVTLECMHGLLA